MDCKMKSTTLLIMVFCLFSQIALGEIFKWVDEEGNVHFSDSKPENKQAKKVTVKVNSYKSVQVIQPTSQNSKASTNKPTSNGKNVIMYSAQWCGVCRKAKRYFSAKGIHYTELDIDKNSTAKKQYKMLNASGIPVIFVNDIRLNGFSPRSFEQIYFQ